MKRRGFLQSLVALVATPVSAASAVGAAPQSASFISALTFADLGVCLQSLPGGSIPGLIFKLNMAKPKEGEPPLQFRITKHAVDPKFGVEIDKNQLEHFINKTLLSYAGPISSDISINPETINFCIQKVSGSIAYETKRGKGNHIVIHESNKDLIKEDYKNYCESSNINIRVTEDPIMKDKILVYYKGDSGFDSGLIFTHVDIGEEKIRVQVHTNETDLVNPGNYIKVINLI